MENEKKCKVFHILTIAAICLSVISIIFSSFSLGYSISRRNDCPVAMGYGMNGANNMWNRMRGASREDVKKWWTEYGRPFISEETERSERLGPNDNQRVNKKKNNNSMQDKQDMQNNNN